jgi:hypothetical protein
MSSKQSINRRHCLHAIGVCVSLPILESMIPSRALAAGTARMPKRMAAITQSLGVLHDTFFPTGESRKDYEMPKVLSELEPIRRDMTVFANIDHGLTGGHHAAGGVLNGVKPEHAAKSPFGAISVDQRIAEVVGSDVRFDSLRFWGAKQLTASVNRQGSKLPCSALTPSQAFKAMFLQGNEADKLRARALLREGESILDLVSGDARRLSKRLGQADSQKLDEYFESVRSVEVKLGNRDVWLDRPKPECPDPTLEKLGEGSADSLGMAGTTAAWMDIMHLALVTDSTRVTSLTIDLNARLWDLSGVSTGAHTLSHHGKEEWKMKEFRVIQKYLLSEYRRFILKLKNDTQPDGTSLLDNTLVLYASGLSNGATHSNNNLPVILAGGQSGQGGYHNVDSKQRLNSLYLSMLQWFDPTIDHFNNADKPLAGFQLA